MDHATERARERYGGHRLAWVSLERSGDARGPPDPGAVLPVREPVDVKDDPVAKAYRSMFWGFDVDPTKRRPAGEALARRATENALPEIHPLVDAYNLASAVTLVPLSAFDRDSLDGPLELDEPREGDRLDAIGEAEPVEPTGHHPVWRDGSGVVGLACYRDGQRTALDASSTQAVCVTLLPGDLPEPVAENALRKLEAYANLAGWRVAAPPTVQAVGADGS